jgi:CelD/BcsL family acetyltransferase involved in cellulose biosynthesis
MLLGIPTGATTSRFTLHGAGQSAPAVAQTTKAVRVSVAPLPGLQTLERDWRDLQSRAHASFFVSWPWVAAWLKTYGAQPAAGHLSLMRASLHGETVGLGIISDRPVKRMVGGPASNVYLHQTGNPDADRIFIEYNGFLVDRDLVRPVWAALLSCIAARFETENPAGWAAFHIAGADASVFTTIAESGLPYRATVQHRCHWVDFASLDTGLNSYVQHLSANTRTQVRRSIKLFEASGDALGLKVAASRDEARAFLAELKALHIETWQRRKKDAGAFSAPLFEDFAAELISEGHETGNVDLIRVAAGAETIGVLINFVHDGQVYAYQSGFAYSADNRLKPGLVTHAMAIAHYRNLGLKGYHFMAGESRYKASLGNAVETLTWLTLYRDDFQAKLENALTSMKRHLFSV